MRPPSKDALKATFTPCIESTARVLERGYPFSSVATFKEGSKIVLEASLLLQRREGEKDVRVELLVSDAGELKPGWFFVLWGGNTILGHGEIHEDG